MFFDLIFHEFDRSSRDAAASLSATLNQASNKRAHRRRFSGESLYQRVIDRYTVTFNQVDAMALHYDVPMAAILLFSRVRSEVEHGHEFGAERATRLLNSFRRSIDTLEEMVSVAADARQLDRPENFNLYEHLDYRAFLAFRAVLLESLYPSGAQLGLPIEDPADSKNA